jgi:hypothetical protein
LSTALKVGEYKSAGSAHNAKHHPLLIKSRGTNYLFEPYDNKRREFFAHDPMDPERLFHPGITVDACAREIDIL